MAWRFKASKYKNAAPIVPKPEACIRDVCVGSYQTYGNNIAASAAFMAFNWEHAGSSLAILSLDDCGRKSKTMPLLHAHTDTVTDIMFSPFHDGILATASQDCLVKIWHIPEKGLEQSLENPECFFSHKQRRVETVGFHPTADCLLYSTAAGCVILYDIAAQKECFSNNEHADVIQSLSWKQDGTVFATSCKDKIVRINDPRATNGQNIQMTADSHQSIKDSRVVWLGDQPRILTTGFDAARVRQVIIRDIRNFSVPEKLLELDCSTGILMPLFDPDTNMLFLAGKGDTTINYMEVTDKDPYLIEGLRHTGEQTKGACLVPKRALKVMDGEVNRVLQLTSNMVIPIMYQVPRKTYRDFHSDLYPETNGYKTDLTANQWMSGTNLPLSKMSLDPSKREHGDAPIIIHRGNLSELIKNIENKKLQMQQKGHQNGQHLTGPITNPGFFKTTTNNITRNSNKIERVVGSPDESLNKVKKNETTLLEDIDDMEHNQKQQQQQQQQFAQKTSNEHDDPCEKPLSKFDLIKRFDNKYKTDSEKDTQGLPKANKANKIVNDDDTTPTTSPPISDVIQISGESNENDSSNDSNDGNSWTSPQSITPPKPLPRTSRNNSITDIQLTTTIQPIPIDDDGGITGQPQQITSQQIIAPRPVARPRTTATSYKPRLGPKPFSSNTGDVSFDKVFSVPQAPGSGDADNSTVSVIQQKTIHDTNGIEPELKKPFPPPDLIEIQIKKEEKDNNENNKNGHQEQKSLTTSERRKYEDEDEKEKLFEMNNSESSGNSTESEDKPDDLKRLSTNRSSIAERRRLYENRSKSMQEDKPQSPVPLIRRDTVAKTETDANIIRHSMPPPTAPDNSEKLTKSSSGKKINTVPTATTDSNKENSATFTKRTSTVFGKVSKFRHLKGTPGHKSTQIENLRNLSRQIPGECNGFHANHERVAVPLSGPGGKVAIFELNKPGRLPDGVIPSLVNGSNIMDFQWDPFDSTRLAVACDDGVVRFWIIPNGGLTEPTNKSEAELIAHLDKIYFIRFHPLAEDVLLTASYDMTIKLWNLKTMKEQLCLKGHSDQIFDFQFSPCGVYGATVCKDTKLRVYNMRKSENPIREGNGPVGTRGARLAWAIDGQYIVVTGFDKVSERQISIYDVQNLSTPLGTVSLDVSPSILIPFYDEDSSTVFVTGKGDSTIYCYEITDEEPFICPLSHHRCSTLHQGLSFLTKNHCDVASVEFSKAYRLTNTTIEPLSFTVPRIKSELFQDDLFPPTRIVWKPTMSSDDWFSSNDKRVKKISLQPEGMECLSSIQPIVSNKKTDIQQALNPSQLIAQSDFEKSRQQKIQKSVSAVMEYNTKLEQDTMEGVDENEWDE